MTWFFLKDKFLECWNFFTTADPTHGYVQYVSEDEAVDLGLFRVTNASSVYLGNLEHGEGSMTKGSEGLP